MSSKNRIKQYIKDARNKPCADCHLLLPDMTFDHLPQYKKCFGISGSLHYSFGQIQREIAKCEVVCRKCHNKREGLRRLPKVMIDREYKKELSLCGVKWSYENLHHLSANQTI